MENSRGTVAVVGAGLVGSVAACFFADRGYEVKIFELRPDIRTLEHVKGRSINMALSERGRSALRHVGIEEKILEKAIPMYARYMHGTDGKTWQILYGKKHQCIYSIDRRLLNEELITAAEIRTNVTFYFQHKLLKCNADTGDLKLLNVSTGDEVSFEVDLIVGADGAYSATRRELMKNARFDYAQTYIPHGYMELSIPPAPDGQFAMPKNYLHIWPRNEFMMIGLPNPDKSFTVTLFMPFQTFDSIKTDDQLIEFFDRYFKDAVPLMGEKLLKDLYFSGKALPMISVKSSPHHFGEKAVLIGDAAHAMVPFYGQGMNCGLEDCLVFDNLLAKFNGHLPSVLKAYSEHRVPDAQAMCDLAMYNYIEMRAHVNTWSYLARKVLDNLLYTILPSTWVPLYTSVSFTRMRYSVCISNKKQQDQWINRAVKLLGVSVLVACGLQVKSLINTSPRSATQILENLWTMLPYQIRIRS